AAVQERRDMHAVHDAEPAVAVLDVELPDLLAVEVEAGQVAGTGEDVDVFAVGAGRGRGVVALAAEVRPARAAADGAFPALLAVGASADQDEVVAVGAGQEEAVAPEDGRRAAHPRYGQLPDDVLVGAPLDGDLGRVGDAVVVRAAPLGPVVGAG